MMSYCKSTSNSYRGCITVLYIDSELGNVVMNSFRWCILSFSLCIIVVIGCTYLLSKRTEATGISHANPIVVLSEDLDFGTTLEQDAFTWRLPVTNKLSEKVTISSIEASCGCTSVSPEHLNIPPNGTELVLLTLDLTGVHNDSLSEEATPFEVTLSLQLSSPVNRMMRMPLKGRVKKLLNVIPHKLNSVVVKGHPVDQINTTIIAHSSVANLHAYCDTSLGVAKIQKSVGPGNRFHLFFTPTTRHLPGNHEGDIQIKALLRDDRHLPLASIPVLVTHTEDIVTIPERIHLGARMIGEHFRSSFVVKSHTGKEIVFKDVVSNEHGFVVKVTPGSKSESHRIIVTGNTNIPGDSDTDIRLEFTDRSQELLIVNLTICYYGVTRTTNLSAMHPFRVQAKGYEKRIEKEKK